MLDSFLPPIADYWRILPEIILAFSGIVVMLLESVTTGKRAYLGYLSLLGLAAAFAVNLPGVVAQPGMAFHNMISVDGYNTFFRCIVIGVGFLSVLASISYLEREELNAGGEFYALILFSVIGQCVMVTAADLIMVFIGLEISSISSYVLAGFLRDDRRNNESALKYFLLGSFATAFFLYGTAWIFGSVGSTNFDSIRLWIPQNVSSLSSPAMLAVGIAMIFVGLAFKVSVVPFQMWAPDVYQGAAAPASGFMSAGPKAAAFAVFFRLFMTAFFPLHDRWAWLIWGCALATMFVGNLGALMQTNVKRMLGYSSIAHAGYVMVALAAANTVGVSAAMFYLASYAVMNIGAFAAIGYVASHNERFVKIDDLSGLGRRQPVVAALLSVFVFSLIGIPLTGGFVGKFYVFQAALNSHLVWLTVLGLVNSAIAAYYYLKIIVAIYMREPQLPTQQLEPPPFTLRVALWVAALGVLALGLFPAPLLDFAAQSAAALTGR